MQPHEERVVTEQKELAERLSKLRAFIDSSPVFAKLEAPERFLLRHQANVMGEYDSILRERIASFKP